MQISVKGKQISVGAALRDRVTERLSDTVEKYFDNPIDASVVFSRDAHRLRADLSVHVGRGILLQGHATADDAYTAFEAAEDRVAKRLRRHKRRLRDHRETKPEKDVERIVAQQYVIAASDEDEPEDSDDTDATGAESDDGAPVVVAESTTEIEALTVGEAVMRLDLADLPALVFRNSAHGRINVLYRRPDGNLGWIDPEAPTAR